MCDEQPTPPGEMVEVTITARDARNATASYHFEFRPRTPGVEEAIEELRHGFIGRIDQRSRPIDSGR